jgi:hypothetical protein
MIAKEDALGDFQLQPTRVETALRQRRQNRRDEVWAGELHGRDVDGDAQRLRPTGCFAAGRADHPFADRYYQTDLLSERNEIGRRDESSFRIMPAQQRFEAGDPFGGEIELWLIDECELAKPAQPASEPAPAAPASPSSQSEAK